MRKIFMCSVLAVVIAFATSSFAEELPSWLQHRIQIEGSFATIFEGDAGFNVNVNYALPLPEPIDRVVVIGGFFQGTFEADDLEEEVGKDPFILKVGGEIRFQKAFLNGSLVPYVKGEVSWVRFDDDESIDKLGVGPGFGINYWITRNFGFGSEFNTVFIFEREDAPEKQINTLMVGPRIRF